MTLTLQDCDAHIKHTLGKLAPSILPTLRLVRETGHWLANAYDWQFLNRPVARLNKRGTITVSGGTWHQSTKKLELTAAFVDYVFLDGDTIEITGGTGATAGFYAVASRADDDNIVLSTSIGAAADAQTDIAATFQLPACAVPTDLGEILKIESSVGPVEPLTYAEIVGLRVNSIDSSTPTNHYALNFYGSPPVTRLEIDPIPTSNETGALHMVYRADWTFPALNTDDGDPLPIEEFMEGLFLQVLRARARGYVEEDTASMAMRLAEIKASDEFKDTCASDAARRPSFGFMSGGAAAQFHGQHRRWHRSDVVVSWPS